MEPERGCSLHALKHAENGVVIRLFHAGSGRVGTADRWVNNYFFITNSAFFKQRRKR